MSSTAHIYSAGWILVFLAGSLSLAIQFYLACFKLDEMLAHLSRCRAVLVRKPLLGNDPLSRYFMLTCIGSLFALPHTFLRNGGLNVKDYKRFPLGLKYLITSFQLLAVIAGLTWLALWRMGHYLVP
ncbi:flagellar biosynthesis repressor FlbT [Pseudomonas sp. CF161]|jgi:hypothetical protein|uniref:flagellar biosynthesis repressor FlbT n=1 Tax=Pseudomonas sp. CF161 TaxID=911241 RepID=UPI0003552781|nr:flagellar biosynthesis repressor FlbT [Pseudomonas sp. CF161]EPL03337.1 hypothetical protein CF161_30480 [Pseudomonas sp. CF161]